MVKLRAAFFAIAFLAARAAAGEPASTSGSAGAQWETPDKRLSGITQFGFEERMMLVPGRAPIPSEWERHLEYTLTAPGTPAERGEVLNERPVGDVGPVYYGRFPDYLRVDIMDRDVAGAQAVHGGRYSVRMQLAGTRRSDAEHGKYDMVGLRRRTPLEVDPEFAYELGGWVRLQDVKREDAFAQLWIEWLDAEGRTLGRAESDRVNLTYVADYMRRLGLEQAPVWVPTPEFRINDLDRRTRYARVWCVASGREMQGYAYFDDLHIQRRPKVAVESVMPNGLMIFPAEATPKLTLRFQGLEQDSVGGATSFRRVIRMVDFLGRAFPDLIRTFEPGEIREGGIDEEGVALDALAHPGCYAIQISLETVQATGRAQEVAKRVIRLARMPSISRRSGLSVEEMFTLNLDVFDPAREALCAAAGQCGVTGLSFPVWREESDAIRQHVPGEEGGIEEGIGRSLSELSARRMTLRGILAPVPEALRGQDRARRGGYTFYRSDADEWEPRVRSIGVQFQPYLNQWSIGDPADPSFSGLDIDRRSLVEQVRDVLAGAPGKRITAPVALRSITAPVETLPGRSYGEVVFVPASTGLDGLASSLRTGFPLTAGDDAEASAAPAVRPGMRSRTWFLELGPIGMNLSLNMEAERSQAVGLARKIALLAASGAEGFGVELADRTASHGDFRTGLIRAADCPRPAYVAYSVLREHLSGAEYIGEFDLAAGNAAYAFERDGKGLVVFWSRSSDAGETSVPCQLGSVGQARLIDLGGAGRGLERPPSSRSDRASSGIRLENAELVPVSPVPAILYGLDPAFIRTRLGFRLAAGAVMQSRYEAQEVSFELRNYYVDDMQARVYPRFPPGFQATPRFRQISVPKGSTASVSFSVRPSFVETVGYKPVTVDLVLASGKSRTLNFTLSRDIEVQSPLELSLTDKPAISEDGKSAELWLQVRLSDDQRFAYDKELRPYGLSSDAEYDVEMSLTIPGRVRQKAQVQGLRVGRTLRLGSPFTVALGPKPGAAFAGAALRGGAWFANVSVELPAAGAPR